MKYVHENWPDMGKATKASLRIGEGPIHRAMPILDAMHSDTYKDASELTKCWLKFAAQCNKDDASATERNAKNAARASLAAAALYGVAIQGVAPGQLLSRRCKLVQALVKCPKTANQAVLCGRLATSRCA
eukprot:6264562-Amphidinium_carterae.3